MAIDDTVRTVFLFKHRLQYKTPRPPNIQNNERYHYSGELSDALSSIFPGLDLIVPDQEPSDPEEKDLEEEKDVEEDSVTTTGCNTYQAETSHSSYSPSDASSNTTSTRSLARTPRTRATREITTPAAVTTEEDNDTTVPTYRCINDSRKS